MEQNPFGKTGLHLSKIGLGTVQFGVDYGYTKKKTQQEVNAILSLATRRNINFLDTANEYGDSEIKIGRHMAKNKSDFVIFTKLKKLLKDQCDSIDSINQAMTASLNESMNNLGINTLDFLLLHQADDYVISNNAVFECLKSFKSSGLVKGVGVSVYKPEEVEFVLSKYGDTIDFFQIPYNIFDRRCDSLLDELFKRNIGVICRSVYLKGLIPCNVSEVPQELKNIIPHKEALNLIADKKQLTPKELALLFVLADQRITATILGIDNPEELDENIKIVDNKLSGFQRNKEMDELQITDEFLIDPRRWNNF